MEKLREEEKYYSIWIDHTDRILSFKSAEGYEQLYFSSHEEKLEFAVEKCSSGYRVQ